jgi:type II secretory pathway component GspD/PulD (secretin)
VVYKAGGGKVMRRTTLLAIGLLIGLFGLPGWAEDQTVNLDVKDATLAEVASLLAKSAGVNVAPTSEVKDQRITLTLTDVPVLELLNVIARMNNLVVDRVGNTYLLAKAGTKVDGGPAVGGGGGLAPPVVAAPARVTVQLPRAATSQTRPAPGSENGPGTAYVPTVPVARPHEDTRLGSPTKPVKGPMRRQSIYLKWAKASEVAAMFGRPSIFTTMTGESRMEMAQTNGPRVHVDLGDTINRTDAIINMVRRQQERSQFQPPTTIGINGLESTRDQFGQQQQQQGQQQQAMFELPEGIQALVGYDLLSALIVVGEPDAIEELQAIIALLDLPPKQIEVEARFVTLSVSDANAHGIIWTLTDGVSALTGQTPASGGATIAFRTATGNFSVLISALQRSNQGKIVNAPRVICQNAQPSTITFSQSIPVSQGGGAVTTSNNVVVPGVRIGMMTVTTALNVVARVTGQPPKESITLTMRPQVQDVIGFVDNPNGGTIPMVASQNIQTLVRVPNGETIAMGGLVRKNNSTSGTKLPLLADLPFIGGLFRSKARNLDESELLIFLTPTVVREPGVDYSVGPQAQR